MCNNNVNNLTPTNFEVHCRITVTFPSGETTSCSSTKMADDRLATAAHCIYSKEEVSSQKLRSMHKLLCGLCNCAVRWMYTVQVLGGPIPQHMHFVYTHLQFEHGEAGFEFEQPGACCSQSSARSTVCTMSLVTLEHLWVLLCIISQLPVHHIMLPFSAEFCASDLNQRGLSADSVLHAMLTVNPAGRHGRGR